jgi:hypothetical protein
MFRKSTILAAVLLAICFVAGGAAFRGIPNIIVATATPTFVAEVTPDPEYLLEEVVQNIDHCSGFAYSSDIWATSEGVYSKNLTDRYTGPVAILGQGRLTRMFKITYLNGSNVKFGWTQYLATYNSSCVNELDKPYEDIPELPYMPTDLDYTARQWISDRSYCLAEALSVKDIVLHLDPDENSGEVYKPGFSGKMTVAILRYRKADMRVQIVMLMVPYGEKSAATLSEYVGWTSKLFIDTSKNERCEELPE